MTDAERADLPPEAASAEAAAEARGAAAERARIVAALRGVMSQNVEARVFWRGNPRDYITDVRHLLAADIEAGRL